MILPLCHRRRPAFPVLLFAAVMLISPLARADTELLSNGDFSRGSASWVLDHIHNGNATFVVADGAGEVEVGGTTASAWQVQLFQTKLNIEAGKTYHLRFRARSEPGSNILVNMKVDHAPWNDLWNKRITLGTDWQDFSFDITPKDSTDRGRITFSGLGAQPGYYWFGSVSLTISE